MRWEHFFKLVLVLVLDPIRFDYEHEQEYKKGKKSRSLRGSNPQPPP